VWENLGTMGAKVKKTKDTRSLATAESEEEVEEVKASIFQRLFAPASAGTSYSQDDDGSAESEANLSTLSVSTASHDSRDEESEKTGLHKFDRELRTRHRGACKNMTVSLVPGRDRWSLCINSQFLFG
jgi:hypothetical protein